MAQAQNGDTADRGPLKNYALEIIAESKRYQVFVNLEDNDGSPDPYIEIRRYEYGVYKTLSITAVNGTPVPARFKMAHIKGLERGSDTTALSYLPGEEEPHREQAYSIPIPYRQLDSILQRALEKAEPLFQKIEGETGLPRDIAGRRRAARHELERAAKMDPGVVLEQSHPIQYAHYYREWRRVVDGKETLIILNPEQIFLTPNGAPDRIACLAYTTLYARRCADNVVEHGQDIIAKVAGIDGQMVRMVDAFRQYAEAVTRAGGFKNVDWTRQDGRPYADRDSVYEAFMCARAYIQRRSKALDAPEAITNAWALCQNLDRDYASFLRAERARRGITRRNQRAAATPGNPSSGPTG